MHNHSGIKIFSRLLSQYTAAVVYDYKHDEVNINARSIPLLTFLKRIVLPADKNSDPFVWADKCMATLSGFKVCVFVPGRTFDLRGTRHGRGGGWYDRFLSKIPKDWLRVGVASTQNVSPNTLKREDWDEPIDWLLISDGIGWKVVPTGVERRGYDPSFRFFL